MAWIKCPECSAMVSDGAQNCPNCGYPLNRRYRPKTQGDINVWYYELNGQAIKISERELCEKIRNGSISSNALVVNSEIKQWTPLKNTQIYINNAPISSAPVQNRTYSESSNTSGSSGIAGIALALAIISLFVFPVILAVTSFILSIISFAVERRGHAAALSAILISIISVWLYYCMSEAFLLGLFR